MNSNQAFYLKLTLQLVLVIIMIGCSSRKSVEIPDAPPPYANFPTPQNYQNPRPAVTPTQNNTFATPYYPEQQTAEFSSLAQRGSDDNLYTLKAEADLWALIQDPNGIELDWIKMKPGESTTLNYIGPITVTCSSGHKLKIFDKQNKLIETKANHSGISIVKLP